jgi:hypothetical protein
MNTTVIGYQYNPDTGKYTGEYVFPKNMDSVSIHLPPNTVLEHPPITAVGEIAVMINDVWEVRAAPELVPSHPPIDNYALLTDGYIGSLISAGLWTAEDQQMRNNAIGVANGN